MASVASAAASSEKQRRHRACRNAGPSKRHEYLVKERRKWRERDDTGKVKPSVLELNKRDESNKRKYWKEGRQKQVRKRTTGNLSSSAASENLDNTTAQRGHSRMSASAPQTESTMMTRSKESASSNAHNGLELLMKATHIIRSKLDSSDQYSSDKIPGSDSGNEGSAKTSGSNSSTPVMSSNCSIRTRASTGVISGSINKTDIKSEGCPSPSSDTCSSRSGTPQSFKRTRGKIDDIYIVQIPPKKQKIGRNDGTGINNKNDYFCWICHRDGVMIFCELCPRVYHIKCLGLEESPLEWVCPECERIMRAECVDTRSKSMSMITQEQFCALLKHALTRMKHQTSSPFRQPVDLCAVPNYHDFIYHPMDLTTIEKNTKENKYGSTEAFLADVKWILHNCIIFNGTHHKLTGSAKMILKICKHEMTEIEICPDCYARSCEQTTEEWFCEPCNNPHRIVWAKLKGYPFWPAKALREKNGMVDVRFFGAHDRSWVPISQVYGYSKECPTVMRSKRSGFDYSMSELERYIEKYKEKFGSFEYAPFRTLYDNSSPYLEKNGKNSPKIKPLQIYPSPASSNSPDATILNQKKKQSTKAVSEKMSEKVSVITKTASAVKNKYSSIITTRRGAMMKMMQQTSTTVSTASSSAITTTAATAMSKETTSQKVSTTTDTTTAATTKVTSATSTKTSPKATKLKAKRTISSAMPLPKKMAIPGVFFPSVDSCSELPEKSLVKVCLESVGNVDDKICGKSTIPPLLNIKREPGLEDEEVANSLILNSNRGGTIMTSPSSMEASSSKQPEKLIAPSQIKRERESPVDIIQTRVPPQKSSKECAANYSQNFHRMVKTSNHTISASANAQSKDGEISAHPKTVEIISPVLTTKKGKANCSSNGHLFEGENKMSIVQSAPQKRNSLKSISDPNSLSAFRPPSKNQNNMPEIQRNASDPQMTVMEPNSSSSDTSKNSNRKILMPKIGSLSAANRRSLEDSATISENNKSNLSLPTATTEATLLLGLLKNKINSNTSNATASSGNSNVSSGSSTPARNDISRPVEINQLVEKYTKQLSKNIQESFEEMYADMLTKHSHQVIMKHYHQELEKLRWIHEQEIAEIKHNSNLMVAEIRASWENEKERYGNNIRDLCEVEKLKAVEETKKKQWCANCGKEALLYCCWNTSYCDYQCQASHWPQHMTSCTQQLPQSTQVTQLTVPAPIMTTATSTLTGTLVTPTPQGVVALSEVRTKTSNSNTTTPIVIPNLRQQQQQQQQQQPQQQQQQHHHHHHHHHHQQKQQPVSTTAPLPEIKSVETINTPTPKSGTRASGMLQQIVKKDEIRPKMVNLQPVSTTVSGPTQIQFVPTSPGGPIQVLPAPSTQLLSRNPIISPSHHLQLQYVQSAQHFQTYAAASGQTPVRMQTVQLQNASHPSTLQGQSSYPSIIANPQPVVATAAISSTTNTKINTITVPTVTSSAPKNIKPNAKNILIPPGSFILTKAPQGQLQLNAKQM